MLLLRGSRLVVGGRDLIFLEKLGSNSDGCFFKVLNEKNKIEVVQVSIKSLGNNSYGEFKNVLGF